MFDENSNIFSKEYEINYYDVDCNLKCKLSTIVNFFCDIGTKQAEKLGETIEYLTKENYAWVFYKYDINVHQYPMYGDKIKVSTAAIGFNRFYAFRGYTVQDSDGNILVEAKALFFCIDIKKRRPARVTEERMLNYSGGIKLPTKVSMKEASDITKEDYSKEFNIRYSDIDSNGHVNNVNYIEWAIESVPLNIVEDYKLSSLQVTFEKETMYGESVHVSTEVQKDQDNIKTIHVIKSSDDKILTKLEIEWIKIDK